jgi:hypothetical protein
MKKKKLILPIVFILVGAVAGYAYWYFIGCNSGTCPITSNWHNTSIYGGVMGYLLGSSVIDMKTKNKEAKE